MRYAHTPQNKSGGDGHTNPFAETAEPGAVGGGRACASPDFGTSVNPISTRGRGGADYSPQQIFRPPPSLLCSHKMKDRRKQFKFELADYIKNLQQLCLALDSL